VLRVHVDLGVDYDFSATSRSSSPQDSQRAAIWVTATGELIAWCDPEGLSYPGVAAAVCRQAKTCWPFHESTSKGLQKRIHVQFSVDPVIEE
jgi:hypothetical protein